MFFFFTVVTNPKLLSVGLSCAQWLCGEWRSQLLSIIKIILWASICPVGRLLWEGECSCGGSWNVFPDTPCSPIWIWHTLQIHVVSSVAYTKNRSDKCKLHSVILGWLEAKIQSSILLAFCSWSLIRYFLSHALEFAQKQPHCKITAVLTLKNLVFFQPLSCWGTSVAQLEEGWPHEVGASVWNLASCFPLPLSIPSFSVRQLFHYHTQLKNMDIMVIPGIQLVALGRLSESSNGTLPLLTIHATVFFQT